MANKQLGIGVEIWVVRRSDYGVYYEDGPFRIVGYDRLMVYAVRDAKTPSGEFFLVEDVTLEHEAAKETVERRNASK